MNTIQYFCLETADDTTLLKKLFVAFLSINQFRRVGLNFFVGFMTGTPRGSPLMFLRRSWG